MSLAGDGYLWSGQPSSSQASRSGRRRMASAARSKMLPWALKVSVGGNPRAPKYVSMPRARERSATVGTRNPSARPSVSIHLH
eukprot:11258333-Alexandrium_andersonii.AAC.1